jgi:hypothetical protein
MMATRKVKGLRRTEDGTASAADPEFDSMQELQLVDVALQATTERGEVEVPRLGLAFDRRGMTVNKWTGDAVGLVPWPLIRRMSTEVLAPAAAGSAPRVTLGVESDRRQHRFVISQVDASALTAILASMSTRYAGRDLVAVEPRAKGGRR